MGAKRLEGSAIYLALKLSGGSRKTVDHAGGYGRKKRQSIKFEEEAIMQQIFPVQDDINEIEKTASFVTKPEIKAWGETGLVKNNSNVRKKRQSITFEEEAIMQQIFPVQDDINEIEQTASLVIKPKIKVWGETGLVKNNNS